LYGGLLLGECSRQRAKKVEWHERRRWMMQRHSLLRATLVLLLLAGGIRGAADKPAESEPALAEAVRATAALRGYWFKVEEATGRGAGAAVEGKYEKGQAAAFKADGIEFFRAGEALAYKDGAGWQRSKTGTLSDPLRVLGAAARVRGTRLPHEELTELARGLKGVKKMEAEAEGSTVYAGVFTGTLDEEAAGKLAPASLRSVARGGQARLWVGLDGQVHKYSLTIRVQGTLGNAEIDGQVTRSVTLSDRGTARVEVPAEAKKALE
jgi:hypothetical protein